MKRWLRGSKDRHCLRKVRHADRSSAIRALHSTLGDRDELMAPYACKLCAGWHNGHRPIDRYRAYEPRCSCGHRAITHESFPGVGCNECTCLAHREWLYRIALKHERVRGDREISKRRRLEHVIRAIVAALPRDIAANVGKRLWARFAPEPRNASRVP